MPDPQASLKAVLATSVSDLLVITELFYVFWCMRVAVLPFPQHYSRRIGSIEGANGRIVTRSRKGRRIQDLLWMFSVCVFLKLNQMAGR